MAKIDILLPYWGDFELLRKAVESVVAQTETNWQLLVFDDHYPSDEAKKYFKTINDRRITYFRHSKNLGITKNFNYALNASTAKYCVMLGCDDILLPNYIARALDQIGDADFYQPNVEVIDEDDKVYLPVVDKVKKLLRPNKPGLYSGEKLATSLCHGNWLYFPSIMWRAASIRQYGFDEKYKIVEDVALELNLIMYGGILFLDNEVTFQYRRSAKSLSSKETVKGGVRFTEENKVYDDFAKEFKEIGWRKASRAAKLRIISRIHQLMA